MDNGKDIFTGNSGGNTEYAGVALFGHDRRGAIEFLDINAVGDNR